MIWDAEEILGSVIVIVGLLGYSTLIPTPATPRAHWLPRSLVASSVAAVSVLVAVVLWNDGSGHDRDELSSLPHSVGPYLLGGWLALAAGTYLKVRLWQMKNEAMEDRLSRHD